MDGVAEQSHPPTAGLLAALPFVHPSEYASAFAIAASDSDVDDDYVDDDYLGEGLGHEDDPYSQVDFDPFDTGDSGDHDFGPDFVGYNDGTPLWASTSSPARRAQLWAQRFDTDPQRASGTRTLTRAHTVI